MLEIIGKLQNKLYGMPAECQSIATELEALTKSNALWNDRTGAARQSIQGSSTGSGGNCTIELSIGVPYGEILEKGSRSHIIEGNPYLYWEGAPFPMRRVNHPGTKGFNALHNAASSGYVEKRIIDYWSDL